jgi:hypothetical protein
MIKTLQKLWTDHQPLDKYFTWDIPTNCPIKIPSGITTPFDRNVYLKNNFHSRLTSTANKWSDYFWIIQDWGGIKSFKDNTQNRELIDTFFAELPNNKLSKTSHDRLSSLSKLAAFKYPRNYSIYDSRAVFSLNWLLFCTQENPELFPQPPGRSKSLTEWDPLQLIRMSKHSYKMLSHKEAYFKYCDMLKDLSKNALGKDEPFYLEMLLFVAAERWIPEDIKTRTQVTIRK